jgi:hypothetical protein
VLVQGSALLPSEAPLPSSQSVSNAAVARLHALRNKGVLIGTRRHGGCPGGVGLGSRASDSVRKLLGGRDKLCSAGSFGPERW